MADFHLKATHAPLRAYYEALERFGQGNFDNEGNIRGAFERLLEHCARRLKWTVVPEYKIARKAQHPVRVDAALIDEFNLPRAYWEAKDSKDNLEKEIQEKFRAGYPRNNILFQTPTRAVLYQNGAAVLDTDITQPENLVDILRLLFAYSEPHIREWETAVREFANRIPEIAAGAMKLIEAERKTNKAFLERFAAFAEVCRESINPELRDDAVEKMLVQHLLTERIFRRIFDNSDFSRRNVIAVEIEKVIASLTQRQFSRDQFLRPLDRFYKAIEEAASQTTTYSEKQSFLNVVYEKFFQRFDAKQADTHGIVYTPQPIVDFMVRSVEEVLKQEFGRSLSDEGVHILDPFVGTGTFITRVMQEIRKTRIEKKYANELHCNEIMLLPYYIASMNIEHTFLDMTGRYEPFEGICLVDTFELAESKQRTLFTTANTDRVNRQKAAPIRIIIGNPPYNIGQDEENDNNKNRKYKVLDREVSDTYARDSRAQNKNGLQDPYIRALKWASNRIGPEGIVAFVTNRKFIQGKATDGVRKHLADDFSSIRIIDLGGDVRSNTKLSGTRHNVFGIQLGVCVAILVRGKNGKPMHGGQIAYASAGETWTKEQKYNWLTEAGAVSGLSWLSIIPNAKHEWLTAESDQEFGALMPLHGSPGSTGLFSLTSNGLKSNRDHWVFNFSSAALAGNMRRTISFYNEQVQSWRQAKGMSVDQFVTNDDQSISWSRDLKKDLKAGKAATFEAANIRESLFRPFQRTFAYFDKTFNEEIYRLPAIFPRSAGNRVLLVTAHPQVPFSVQATDVIPCVDAGGRPSQLFPFYTYDEDGSHRRENITDWALAEFRSHYGQRSISKWDIFHYTYAVLHHPEYRTRYAANLKRELPRTPFAPDFSGFAAIGKKLMDLHIHYEQQPEYPLGRTETGQLDWRVKKMRLSKDKTKLVYNGFLTLCDIPPEVYEYRLGNRSALEWVVDQYCVSTDKRSGIVNDPNREDDPEYIVRLIGQVVTVSLETVKLVRELGTLALLPEEPPAT